MSESPERCHTQCLLIRLNFAVYLFFILLKLDKVISPTCGVVVGGGCGWSCVHLANTYPLQNVKHCSTMDFDNCKCQKNQRKKQKLKLFLKSIFFVLSTELLFCFENNFQTGNNFILTIVISILWKEHS